MDIKELIKLWNTDEGKPFKGGLINMHSWEQTQSLGCMCAQGQILNQISEFSPVELYAMFQNEADRIVADELNISRIHSVLLRVINDQEEGAPATVLTNPEKVLGSQYEKILYFWNFIETNNMKQYHLIYSTTDYNYSVVAAGRKHPAYIATLDMTSNSDTMVQIRSMICGAVNEIVAVETYQKEGREFFFLPQFGFDTPEDIPNLPEGYGMEWE